MLAITTTTGQGHERRGRALLYAFAAYTRSTAVVSPPDSPATLDAVYSRDGVLVAVAEAKTRGGLYDFEKIVGFGSYLVTDEKLRALLEASRSFGVPSYLLTELSDGVRLYWPIGSPRGEPVTGWTVAASRTLATSVGPETVVRRNAYLPLAAAVRWDGPKGTP